MTTAETILGIVGPTASGKKSAAQAVAENTSAEIISLDSMKVYRGMDIGTAKPMPAELEKYHYHLIDLVEPTEHYDVARFLTDCETAITNIRSRKHRPLLAVGTPLYLRALLYGLFNGPTADKTIRAWLESEDTPALYQRLKQVDETRAAQIHPNDRRRIIRSLEVYELTGRPISEFQTHFGAGRPKTAPRYRVALMGLNWKRPDLYERIDRRVEQMFSRGLVEEVKRLWTDGLLGPQTLQAIAYQEIIQYLEKKLTLTEAKELIRNRTHNLARKQLTWFRTFPEIHWLDVTPDTKPEEIVTEILHNFKESGMMS